MTSQTPNTNIKAIKVLNRWNQADLYRPSGFYLVWDHLNFAMSSPNLTVYYNINHQLFVSKLHVNVHKIRHVSTKKDMTLTLTKPDAISYSKYPQVQTWQDRQMMSDIFSVYSY